MYVYEIFSSYFIKIIAFKIPCMRLCEGKLFEVSFMSAAQAVRDKFCTKV